MAEEFDDAKFRAERDTRVDNKHPDSLTLRDVFNFFPEDKPKTGMIVAVVLACILLVNICTLVISWDSNRQISRFGSKYIDARFKNVELMIEREKFTTEVEEKEKIKTGG